MPIPGQTIVKPLEDQIETVHLVQGDCLKIMQTYKSGVFDAIVTDPPWIDYKTGRTDKYDDTEFQHGIIKLDPNLYANEFYRLLKNNTSMLLWCRWDVFQEHSNAMRYAGFEVKNCVVWAKSNHTAGDLEGNLGFQHECAVFATKGKWVRGGKRETNLWKDSTPALHNRYHPTEKPLELMQRSVRLVCPIGGLVLDPFAGSGTTGLACVMEDRRCVMIEKEPKYCDIIRKRLWLSKTEENTHADTGSEDIAIESLWG